MNLILEQGDACPAILLGFTVFLLTVVRAREIQGKMLILSKTSTSSAADSPKKGRILAAGGTVLKDIDVALDGSNAKVIPFLL